MVSDVEITGLASHEGTLFAADSFGSIEEVLLTLNAVTGEVLTTLPNGLGIYPGGLTSHDPVSNQPPTVTIDTAAQEVTGGATLQLNATAADSDGTIAATDWTGSGSFSDDAIEDPVWTAPAAQATDQDYVLRITVTDNGGATAFDEVTMTVPGFILTAPVFAHNTGNHQSWTVGSFILALTVPAATGNPTPAYTASGLPGGISFNPSTRVLSGTPSAASSGIITITATNSQGTDTWTVTYIISAALAAPAFSDNTGDAQNWVVGTAITNINVPTATGNPTPTYTVSGLPAGMAFSSTLLVISGTPGAVGSGTITVTATNSQGSATWTVGYTTSALLVLADFDTTGLDVDVLALFVAAAPTDIYADANRGGTQTPEDGELGIGSGPTLITRIRVRDNGDRVGLNDNNVPGVLDLNVHFGAGGTTSAWTLTIQTAAWAVSSNQVGTSAGNFINWTFGADDAALLDGIAAGDLVIIAIAQAAAVAVDHTVDAGGRVVDVCST